MSMRPYSNKPRSCPFNAARRYHCRARLRSGGCFVAYAAAKLLHAAGSGERRIQARAAFSSLFIKDVWLTTFGVDRSTRSQSTAPSTHTVRATQASQIEDVWIYT